MHIKNDHFTRRYVALVLIFVVLRSTADARAY